MKFVHAFMAVAMVAGAAAPATAQDNQPPMNADYVLIAAAPRHERSSYITALGRQGDEVKVWMVDVFAPPGGPPPGEPTWSAALQTYNCATNRYSYVRAESYDANNRSLRVYDNLPPEPQAIATNRPAYAVLQVVCGRAEPVNEPVHGVAGVIADARAKAAAEAGT